MGKRLVSIAVIVVGLVAVGAIAIATLNRPPEQPEVTPGLEQPEVTPGQEQPEVTPGQEQPEVTPGLEPPAIWPAADVVFATPEEAAQDFVSRALGVSPVLGEFRQGDARSGEIEVLFLGELGDRRIVQSLLLLRQLGPDDGWFVLAAVNDNISIASPQSASTVPAGPLVVEGQGRGFERTVIVTALHPGDPEPLAQEITMGGDFDPEPFSVTLDLSGASPGAVVTLLVRGGTGAADDPGEFSAIPVVIAP